MTLVLAGQVPRLKVGLNLLVFTLTPFIEIPSLRGAKRRVAPRNDGGSHRNDVTGAECFAPRMLILQ